MCVCVYVPQCRRSEHNFQESLLTFYSVVIDRVFHSLCCDAAFSLLDGPPVLLSLSPVLLSAGWDFRCKPLHLALHMGSGGAVQIVKLGNLCFFFFTL